jgi:hypothetical protein
MLPQQIGSTLHIPSVNPVSEDSGTILPRNYGKVYVDRGIIL